MKIKLSTVVIKGILLAVVWKAYFSIHTIIRPLIMGAVATPVKLDNSAESFLVAEMWESVFNNAIWIAFAITLLIVWKEGKELVKQIVKKN